MECGAASPRKTSNRKWPNDERAPFWPPPQGYGAAADTGRPPPVAQGPHERARGRPAPYLIAVGILLFVLGYVVQTPVDAYERTHARAAWAEEERQHRDWVADMHAERHTWLADRRKREDVDRREREEMERKRRGIEWRGLEPGQCMRYGVREYTSVLGNVPLGVNPVDECWAKSAHIHGRELLPSQCEDKGYCGKVTGHWEVDFIEPECTATWGQIVDKGCEGTLRRYDGELVHISELDNWKAICSTMPSATYPPDIVLGPDAFCSECHGSKCGSGYWATWHVKDRRCEG
ncbi:hypothetical protein BJ912DRAFT_991953 [Pholiota molesta]|nr:hypothetical protein BJ912DRAFT_991953 [Pholiota molesta]